MSVDLRVLVCGSRGYENAKMVERVINQLPPTATVIHGVARGADLTAEVYAKARDLKVERFPADWDSYGNQAGFKRNLEMLATNPGLVIAFWDGESRGTLHTITQAVRQGIRVRIYP